MRKRTQGGVDEALRQKDRKAVCVYGVKEYSKLVPLSAVGDPWNPRYWRGFNRGDPTSRYPNEVTNDNTLFILDDDRGNNGGTRVQFFLERKYKEIMFTLSPYKDMSENGSGKLLGVTTETIGESTHDKISRATVTKEHGKQALI